MSKPSCRELLDLAGDVTSRDEEAQEIAAQVRVLASRVERVLAFCAESKTAFGLDLEHSDPVVRALARGRVSAAEQVEKRLNGEES